MEKVYRQAAVYAVNAIKRRIREGKVKPPTSKKDGTTLVESARLLNSITYRIEGNTIIVGTNVKYAQILHEGGIIKPKSARALAIPLQPIAKVKSPREFDNTFIRHGIIFQKKVDDGDPIPLFKLQKSVVIPPRPFMYLESHEQEHLKEIIIKAAENYIRRDK